MFPYHLCLSLVFLFWLRFYWWCCCCCAYFNNFVHSFPSFLEFHFFFFHFHIIIQTTLTTNLPSYSSKANKTRTKAQNKRQNATFGVIFMCVANTECRGESRLTFVCCFQQRNIRQWFIVGECNLSPPTKATSVTDLLSPLCSLFLQFSNIKCA